MFSIFGEDIKPKGRKTYQAYDGLNNIFNLCYKALSWRVHVALITEEAQLLAKYLRKERKEWKPRIVNLS